MYEIKVQLTGIAPHSQHRLTDEDINKIEKGSTGGKTTQADNKQAALDRMYYRPDGYIGVPKRNIKSCLLEGVKRAGLKFGRGSLAPYIKATVYIKEEMPSLGVKMPDFIERFAVQRKDGNQAVVIRGGLNTGWELDFTLVIVDERRDPEQLKVGFEEAGMIVGLGAGRPDYGRFEITGWEVVKKTKE